MQSNLTEMSLLSYTPRREISDGLKSVLKDPLMAKALKKAKFNRKGYKFIIKQFILRYRLWSLAKLFDKVGK